MRAFFTLTVFCSAFLLFVIEPIAAKMLLPTFGGSASVWTASMVFFQLALLAGYAYVNWLSRCTPKAMAIIHIVAIGLAALLLDASINLGWVSQLGKTTGASAIAVGWWLTKLLGLQFVVLSASAPLLQKAFAYSRDPLRTNPYFLYAASNAGSLVALLAYPIFIEPRLGLAWQLGLWAGFSRLALLLGFFCLVLVGAKSSKLRAEEPGPVQDTDADSPAPTSRQRLLWVTLAAAPSSLLLGVTTFLTTSVAPIPLLWVVPLSLYLLTFIIAFAHKPRVSATGIGRWVAVAATPLSLALILESATPIIPLAIFHLAVAFFAMLACHLRLSESRPSPRHLTEFYLWLAVGGAVGGLFNGLVAPHLFTTLFEYPLALSACCVLAIVKKPSAGKVWETRDWLWPIGVAALTALVIGGANAAHMAPSTGRTILTIGLPAVLVFTASGRPIRFGLCLLALFATATIGHVSAGGKVLYTGRSFYGVHRVVEDTKLHLRELVHGNTVHGMQSLESKRREEPLTYYSRGGPAGDVFRYFHGDLMKPRVALIGLGVGSLAAYGETGQEMDYFEIDPVVIRIAQDPKLFTFLSDSKARVTVTEGDGRLTLAARPPHSYGLIILDAFSSDAIPVHLLTEEALRMYLEKLEPHGQLLFHISNNYVNLAPILAAEARDMNLVARENDDTDSMYPAESGIKSSKWLMIVRNKKDLLPSRGKYGPWDEIVPAKRGWTDEYSYLLGAMQLSGGDGPG